MIGNSGLRHFKAYRSTVNEMWTPQHYGQSDAHVNNPDIHRQLGMLYMSVIHGRHFRHNLGGVLISFTLKR